MVGSRSQFRLGWLALGLAAVLMAVPVRASAASDSIAAEAGTGVGAALCSLLYGPAKIVYAGGGSVIAGLAWLFSGGDSDVSRPILTAALRGDYVVTPEHLTGERGLEFIGRSPVDRSLRGSSETDF